MGMLKVCGDEGLGFDKSTRLGDSRSAPQGEDDLFAVLARDRRSQRAFLAQPVPDATLHGLLATARRAPSGANLQPGAFLHVVGAARARLCSALVCAWQAGEQEREDYEYFPQPMPMTLRKRQVASAQALYDSIGVARDDRGSRAAQFERNFRFFDAPVALIVTIARDFGPGGYMDLGMTLYGLMLAAQSRGLATCAIGALACFPGVIRRHTGLDDRTNIVCGVAMGYADANAAVNRARTSRCNLEEYFRRVE